MRKNKALWMTLLIGLFILLLAGCGGEKSQEDVTKKLNGTVDDLKGYKAKAEMQMHTGEETQKYDLDVWYQDGDFYKVSLANVDDEKGNQVILKNKDGVFVLTPALNKSFKFQSDWPETSSQPYLFQSLVNDVLQDKEATFESNDKEYVYKTKTNYQSNNNLPFQEIHFSKKDYTPTLVKVLDKDEKTLVEVKFSEFKLDPSFKKEDFEMKKDLSKTTSAKPAKSEVKSLEVMFPVETSGAKLSEKKEIATNDGERVILTYDGEKNFTLIQETSQAVSTLSEPREVKGDIVNLGHTIGAINGDTIEWSDKGVHFKLASDQLTKDELIDVAKSMQGKQTK